MKREINIVAAVIFSGIIIFLIMLFINKSDELNESQVLLDQNQQTLVNVRTELDQLQKSFSSIKTQLTEAQSTSDKYKSQLTEAQKSISDLQNQINILTQPPLVAGQPVETSGQLSRTMVSSTPVNLIAFEQVRGQIINSSTQFPLKVYIQDPSGSIVQDFGLVYQTNFQFTAQTKQRAPLAGTYSIVIANTNGIDFMNIGYKLTYTVYHIQ
jgi:hypothetical protein